MLCVIIILVLNIIYIAKLSSSWPVPVKSSLNWDLNYDNTSRLPMKMKFCMEALSTKLGQLAN